MGILNAEEDKIYKELQELNILLKEKRNLSENTKEEFKHESLKKKKTPQKGQKGLCIKEVKQEEYLKKNVA